jgi:hypothetical protein
MRPPRTAALAAAATAALVAACGAPAVVTPTVAPQATAAASSPPASREVSDGDRGTTVTLRTGGALRVVLHSTYWEIDPASDPAVLRSDGEQTYAPDPPGRCVPGGGCGTVTRGFHAVQPGRAVVTAHRTSCGEALRCTGDAGTWSVTVLVSD